MSDGPRLVLHVGMQQTGARMLAKALTSLKTELRGHGVAYIGHDDLVAAEGAEGWLCDPGAVPARAPAFEESLRALATAEIARTDADARAGCRFLLVSSDHALGSANLGPGDLDTFRPHAETSVRQLVRGMGMGPAEVVLYTRRQDRLMEFCYVREVQKGAHHRFREQFPTPLEPALDYDALARRLEALDEVTSIRVRPFELIAAGALEYIDDFLAAVELKGTLNLAALKGRAKPFQVYTRQGAKLALAMNPHTDTDKERRHIRTFLLDNFSSSEDRTTRFIARRAREGILEAYREINEELFRERMADLPPDGYRSDEHTRALGSVLTLPGDRRAPRSEGRPRKRRADAPEGAAATALKWGRFVPQRVKDAFATLATRLPWLYNARVRTLASKCDVFLISFPKCGRTWLRTMIAIALADHFRMKVKNPMRFTSARVRRPGVPRILATHDDSPQLKAPRHMMQRKTAYADRSVIFLVRDPRDVVVSLFFHKTRRRGESFGGSISDFLRHPVGSLDSILAFYDIWLEHQEEPKNLLLLRYEDLHQDPHGTLRSVLEFIGLDGVSSATVDKAVAEASFDRLQTLEREGRGRTRALTSTDTSDLESYKVRRGKVGGFVDYLDADDIAHMNGKLGASPAARAWGFAPDAAPATASDELGSSGR